MQTLIKLLAVIGAATVIALVGCVLAFLVHEIRDLIDRLEYRHKIRHRFDKPPTAKCYCKDCRLHRKDGKCTLPGIGRYTPPNGFCYEAEPSNDYKGARQEGEG